MKCRRMVLLAIGLLVVLGALFKMFGGTGAQDPPDSLIADLREGVPACEIHGSTLEEELLEVFCGYVEYDEQRVKEYREAEAIQFPHSWSGVVDGPEVAGNPYARVSYCQQCRDAEASWLSENE